MLPSLAQMAIAWILRDPRVTAAVVGARSVEQLDDTLQALDRLDFSAAELTEIDRHATESGINLWARRPARPRPRTRPPTLRPARPRHGSSRA
jgi:diketogulonate reductase-like aldo/keto reductase